MDDIDRKNEEDQLLEYIKNLVYGDISKIKSKLRDLEFHYTETTKNSYRRIEVLEKIVKKQNILILFLFAIPFISKIIELWII